MWVFVKDAGFFSAVENHADRLQVIVRARCRQHAEALAAKTKAEMEWTPDSDYCARVIFPKTTWADFLSDAALGICYNNVKGAIANDDDAFREAMFICWAAMNDFQREREGVGAYSDKSHLPNR